MSLETAPSTSPTRFCPECGSAVGSSTFFCIHCGFSLTGHKREFGAFSFRSRWLILVVILALLAAILNVYLADIVMAGYLAFIIVRNKLSVGALIGKIPSNYNWWPLILMVLGGLAYSLGASVVVMYPLAKLDSEFVSDIMNSGPLSESLASSFILVVILAPLIEEMVFRGLLFSRLTKKWDITVATVVSSLFFGLLHFPLNPIGAFLLGIVACVLYARTRTLLVPIALHAMNNLIAWGLMFTSESEGMDFGSTDFLAQYAFEGLIAMMLGAPIIFCILGRWWPSRGTPIPYEANILVSPEKA